MKRIDPLLTPLLGVMTVAACTSTTTTFPVVVCGPDNVATTNVDVIAATNAEAAWYYATLDPIVFGGPIVTDAPIGTDTNPSSASNAAARAVAAAVDRYFPNGCATATASGNVVTFILDGCSGPLGLLGSTGTFTATLNVEDGTVQTRVAGNNLRASGGIVNLSTSGTFTVSKGQKTLQATSQSTGTGPNGNSITHMGMYTLVWPTGTGCATINGLFSGIGPGTYSGTNTQITNYVTCTSKCPQSGMAVGSFNGGSVTLTFGGSDIAQCSASNGTSASIPLNCR
jgi:hypothetical protein